MNSGSERNASADSGSDFGGTMADDSCGVPCLRCRGRGVAWKIVAGATGRLAIVAVYGVVMLASFVVIAFGLMVAFNC